MWTDKSKLYVIGVSAFLLAACGTPQRTTSSAGSVPVTTTTSSIPTTTSTTSSATGYGVVQAIDVIPREQAQAAGIGIGTVAGAVVGGVLGNQVGSGTGRKAATVAGAAGGALIGHQMEQQRGATNASQVYRVAVRMDNGAVQTLAQEVAPGVQVGDRVRMENGVIVERFR